MNTKLLFNKAMYKLYEKSPVILLTIGIAGVIYGTVEAVKATKNTRDIDDELKEDLETLEIKKEEEYQKLIESDTNIEEIKSEDGTITKQCTGLVSVKDNIYDSSVGYFTKEEYDDIHRKIIFNSVKRYSILYSKAAVIEAVSIVFIVVGFRIIAKRYAGLAAAYAALDTSYREYRKRVQKEVGKDKEEELYYGYKKELKKIKDEKGDNKEVTILNINESMLSPYAFMFDENCSEWSKDPGYNRTFLQTLEKSLTRLLNSQGEISLEFLKDKCGCPHSDDGGESRVIGWKLGHPNNDGYVSLGLYNEYNKEAMNNGNNTWLIDPNIDGLIINPKKFKHVKKKN